MKFKLVCIGAMMLGLSSCGFHVPNQNRLGSNISEIAVSGSYHNKFYKLVVHKLEMRGIKVDYQGTSNRSPEERKDIPTLSITAPSVSLPLASINSRGAALEYNVIVRTQARLTIPNSSKPIIMRNGLTRTTLNKADNALASTNEQELVIDECYEVLADQMIARINYLGKQSDPDEPFVAPAELLLAKDEDNNDIYIDNSRNMTLLEALSAKQDAEVAQGKAVSLSDLNNGMKVLNKNKEYSLPKVEPKIPHEAPESLSEEGFLKTEDNENK